MQAFKMIKRPKFYLMGTKYARTHDVLPLMLKNRVISTGFISGIDLSPIVGFEYSEAKQWLDKRAPKESTEAKNTLARFISMKPGDIVALKAHSAPIGKSPRLVIARYAVIVGEHLPNYSRSEELGHSLSVDLLDEQEPIELSLGYGKTLHVINDEDRIKMIFGKYGEVALNSGREAVNIKDKAIHNSSVKARGDYIMRRAHNKLQNEMKRRLSQLYGEHHVKQEENHVDLMVSHGSELIMFEVKSSPSPAMCIREAFGQLLHYSWQLNPGCKNIRYIIVGPSEAGLKDREFANFVAQETGMRVEYCTPETFSNDNT